jgi:hypothetical protein
MFISFSRPASRYTAATPQRAEAVQVTGTSMFCSYIVTKYPAGIIRVNTFIPMRVLSFDFIHGIYLRRIPELVVLIHGRKDGHLYRCERKKERQEFS